MRLALLALASLRFYGRHPWQLLLAVAGIALGIAVFVGIELANDSARRAFESSTAAVRGQTTHRLLPLMGMLDESVYRTLKRDPRFVASAPVLELPFTLTVPGGRPLEMTLRGIDPVEEVAVRGLGDIAGLADPGSGDLTRLMTEAGGVLLPADFAARFAMATGDRLAISSGGAAAAADPPQEVVVIGTTEAAVEGDPVLIADIATVQEVTGNIGLLSRIDFRLDADAAAALATATPPGTVLVEAAAEDAMLRELTRAFNTNLTALGLLALVVGMFLIYSTISFTIVQRWRPLACLRALGLTRSELLGKLLAEALAIGVSGTLLGLLLGKALSSGLLELVLRTLDDLYLRRELGAAEPSAWIYPLGATLGIGATLLSAFVPALLATRHDVDSRRRSRLERNAATLTRRFAFAAPPTLLAAGLALWLAPRGLVAGFVALFLVLVAGAMLVPIATRWLMRTLETPVAAMAGLPGRLAVRGVGDSLSRTGVATAALAVAVATVMSIGIMIGSFRESLIVWLDRTITADLFVAVDPEATTDIEAALTALAARPDVAGFNRQRMSRVPTPLGSFDVRAQSQGPKGFGIEISEPAGATAEDLLRDDTAVLVAEPLAYRLDLGPGDALPIATASGQTSLRVAGIHRDYDAGGGGELFMDLNAYRRWFDDEALTSIGVYLAPGADEEAVAAAIRTTLGLDRRAAIRSTARIRETSLLIFDRTFKVTEVLRLLAGTVAFLGILSALMALALERERESAVLRSLGLSVRALFGQNLAQTGLLGLTAGLAALPLGTALAWMLVHVINRRSFGWTMDFVVTPSPLLAGLGMAIAAALLAGIYPSWVGARADMGLAWRDE
jgi:putative ABC transport system permease protein